MPHEVDSRFGVELRRFRLARGLSLRDLASLYHGSSSQIQDFETGRKRPIRTTAQRLDDALGALGELVGILYPPEPTVLPRSDFVGAAVGTVAVPTDPRVGRVGGQDVRKLLARTARQRRLDDYLGGADTFHLFQADVEATETLIRGALYTESTGRQLLAVLAEQAQLAGWAAFDAGWYGDSNRLYQMSLTAAEEAHRPCLAGNAIAFMGYQKLAMGKGAVDELTAASDMVAGQTTPLVRALLHCRRAWAHANEGRAGEAEEHLDVAQEALREPPDRPEPDWVYWVNDLEHEIMTGRCWAALRRPVRAITALEAVMRRYDDTHARDKALYASFLADAYLDANEVERACAVTEHAMDLATGVASVRPQQRILAVVRRIDPADGPPCARELRARAAEWVTQIRQLSREASEGSHQTLR